MGCTPLSASLGPKVLLEVLNVNVADDGEEALACLREGLVLKVLGVPLLVAEAPGGPRAFSFLPFKKPQRPR